MLIISSPTTHPRVDLSSGERGRRKERGGGARNGGNARRKDIDAAFAGKSHECPRGEYQALSNARFSGKNCSVASDSPGTSFCHSTTGPRFLLSLPRASSTLNRSSASGILRFRSDYRDRGRAFGPFVRLELRGEEKFTRRLVYQLFSL